MNGEIIKFSQKVHYAPMGEWGGSKVNCGRYWTTDVVHTEHESKVTCKFCSKQLTKQK